MKKKKQPLLETFRRIGGKLNEFRTESGLDIQEFIEVVEMIFKGARSGNEMHDTIVDELGDFYDAVYDSGDKALIQAYDDLRQLQYEDPRQQALAAAKLLKLLK
jgi:hypothetical protein